MKDLLNRPGLDATLAVQVNLLRGCGFHQRTIAEKLGVSQQTVSRYLDFIRAATAILVVPE